MTAPVAAQFVESQILGHFRCALLVSKLEVIQFLIHFLCVKYFTAAFVIIHTLEVTQFLSHLGVVKVNHIKQGKLSPSILTALLVDRMVYILLVKTHIK